MKKLLINIVLLVTLITSAAYASDNSLNSVIIEGTTSGTYHIILRSDRVANVKKTVQEDGTLLLELKNISTSLNLDTKYVNTNAIDNVVVENTSNNGVNIYIQAPDAEKADIIFDTPAAPPVVVSDGISKNQIGWIAAAFLVICLAAGSFKKSVENDAKETFKNDLTEREIKFYKEYKSDIITSAKIDNKIRERLAKARIANITQKAATLRSLQKMSMK